MLENKPGNKKSGHISGKRNIEMTRITGLDSSGRNELGMQDGLKAGMNQPVVHFPDGTRNGKRRSYLTFRATRSAIQCCVVEKKKHRPGNMKPHQSRDHVPAGVGCAPKHSLCGQARAPEPAGPPTTLPITPALGAFIGPKNSIIPW